VEAPAGSADLHTEFQPKSLEITVRVLNHGALAIAKTGSGSGRCDGAPAENSLKKSFNDSSVL
jgi:hypothetical protein